MKSYTIIIYIILIHIFIGCNKTENDFPLLLDENEKELLSIHVISSQRTIDDAIKIAQMAVNGEYISTKSKSYRHVNRHGVIPITTNESNTRSLDKDEIDMTYYRLL